MEVQIDDCYKLTKKLGSGAFGEVFEGLHISNKMKVAIKIEPKNAKHPQILYEGKLYNDLWEDQTAIGIPRVYFSGTQKMYNYIVMDLLGPSLEELFNLCGRRFSLKTVLMVADEIISRIEYLHLCKILHRDIEPANFLIGMGNQAHKIYLIDLGLAKRYINQEGQHIQYESGNKLIGTSCFISLNAHLRGTLGRRDDIESLGYVLLYFLKGQLPWQNLKVVSKKEKYWKILEIKKSISIETLCQGLPQEFSSYFIYVRNLKFNEKPDYLYLRNLFKQLFIKSGFENDYKYDWNLIQKVQIQVDQTKSIPLQQKIANDRI